MRWLVMLAFSCAAANAADVMPRSKLPSTWNECNVFDFTAVGPTSSNRSTIRGAASFSSGDLWIDIRQTSATVKRSGTMIVVAGRELAVRGFRPEPGSEIDALDGPVLFLRMLTAALTTAAPEGPAKVDRRRVIQHTETKTPIRAGTPSAGAEVPPPWSLVGHVEPGPAGVVKLDVELVAKADDPAAPSGKFKLHFTGTLSASDSAPRLSESMSLKGWTLYSLGPRSFRQGSSTILDYGGTQKKERYLTIAELRKAMQVENDPGKPDPKLDLSGFWKESCDQNFGLRIQRSTPEGKYTITFCGPGGCVDDGRQSYITGDKQFQILSIDELKERRGDDWETYRR
ncbi:MAG TPA: hypothetical protein VFL36_06045, partial [Myxococcales bacterium]|nr:hypothetical protein [Myxococcales bacterium]